MKHIKTYEITVTTRFREDTPDTLTIPQKGDYVICKDAGFSKKIEEFLQNNVGQIGIINKDSIYKYVVRYKDVPEELKFYFASGVDDFCRVQMSRKDIVFHSPNRNEARQYIINSKYNL